MCAKSVRKRAGTSECSTLPPFPMFLPPSEIRCCPAVIALQQGSAQQLSVGTDQNIAKNNLSRYFSVDHLSLCILQRSKAEPQCPSKIDDYRQQEEVGEGKYMRTSRTHQMHAAIPSPVSNCPGTPSILAISCAVRSLQSAITG
jgi:hypothetical protein